MEFTNGGKMTQIEELKAFVSERLHAAASEIVGAIAKTITDYEEQATRLKEDSDRHRALLDIILKAKSPQIEAVPAPVSNPAAADVPVPGVSDSSLTPARRTRLPPRYSSGLQCVFTSRTDLIRFAANENCPFCLRAVEATEMHMMKKHYLPAVHFTDDGTEKFVVPCTCKDLIQNRSHWHCPYCKKVNSRRGNFEVHIAKQHGAILHQSEDGELDQINVSAFEEGAPLSPETWDQQEFGSLHQEEQQASLLLQVKEEEVSRPEWQNCAVQLQVLGKQIQGGNSQMSLEADHAHDSASNIVCLDSYIQDISESGSAESGTQHPLPNSSNQPLEMQPHSGVGEIRQPAGEPQRSTPCSSLKTRNSKTKMKRSSPPLSPNIKKSTSFSQSPPGPYSCKACGKTFNYMYTLRTHAQTHGMDKIRICGVCGKHFDSIEGLVHHVQSHTKVIKCGLCGKTFSSNFRLRRHERFHRRKSLKAKSSA